MTPKPRELIVLQMYEEVDILNLCAGYNILNVDVHYIINRKRWNSRVSSTALFATLRMFGACIW